MEASATNTPKDIAVAYLLLRVTVGVNIYVHAALLAFLNKDKYSLDALLRSKQRVRE